MKALPPFSKAQGERAHFRKRMRERQGLRLNREGLRALAAKVGRGEFRPVLEQSRRVRIIALYWEGRVIVLAWDAGREAPVTTLDRDAWMYAQASDGLPGIPARIVLKPGADGYTWSPDRKFARPDTLRPPQGGGSPEGAMGGGADVETRPGTEAP